MTSSSLRAGHASRSPYPALRDPAYDRGLPAMHAPSCFQNSVQHLQKGVASGGHQVQDACGLRHSTSAALRPESCGSAWRLTPNPGLRNSLAVVWLPLTRISHDYGLGMIGRHGRSQGSRCEGSSMSLVFRLSVGTTQTGPCLCQCLSRY